MSEATFLPGTYSNQPQSGRISWRSPSNIALVKYWGKHGVQLPKNTSVSFTLSNCFTETTLHYKKKETAGYNFEVYLDGNREEGFEPKISQFFDRLQKYLPFLEQYSFRIETSNSFPHSSGIASSASGMSALALCLMDLERSWSGAEMTDDHFDKKASFLARLGSGSACRSIDGPLIVWGEHPEIDNSSDLFGTKYPFEVHSNFMNYRDTILLVDKGEKQVSSTVGHGLMKDHPYAEQRFEQANANIVRLIDVFKSGDLDAFIEIVESEALQLHAMMMTSLPYFILMKPNTLEIINRIWKYRNETGSKVCFTLDAGANVHVLYPANEAAEVSSFIESELAQFCKNGSFIHDLAGIGAQSL
ncbi:diphosphomevalonate decarboxylase [Aureitalea sp. L0-47]|uniref:diphosphomevalonate/mevalonate 3,5-bisphosphate decarboxylase family protein n=1 Tax=Aureitalea sp. L0-47 TaxID=2816962 RepID=UPI00223867D9|nr:diphosphomevalonate decarboxylase [Aureitalea sp. L0-47]MCW5518633.1 diphosphomevalonate decarboxylase [Aureitalea sp. L0-47]